MNRRVIIIDDNPDIINDFHVILKGSDITSRLDAMNEALFGTDEKKTATVRIYRLDSATQGKEGFEKVEKAAAQGKPYWLAFVDMRMPPGWDGLETIAAILEVDPQIQIVLCTAYSDYSWDEISERLGPRDNLLILKKPFDTAEVAQIASALTEKWRLERIAASKMAEIRKLNEELEQRVNERTSALRASEARHRSLLESSPDPIIVINLEKKATYVNPAFSRTFGWSSEEFLGNFEDFIPEENHPDTDDALERLLKGNAIQQLETRRFTKDGDILDIHLSLSLYHDRDGNNAGFIMILRDITERKAADKALEEAKEAAETANRAKSEFLANMSHEIRTPLNGILGIAELLMDVNLEDDQKELFQTITTEVDSLQEIINDTLDFSKIEAGKLELENIPFNLDYLIEDVANSVSYRAARKGLVCYSFVSPEIQTQVTGDPGRLRQILNNLTNNALKFTARGEISIQADLEEDLGDRIKVRFSVIDTGIGIPTEKQATIFDSFTQADGSTTRKYGGTGLGTTICKQLSELMQGEIGVNSRAGKGATFWFTAVFTKQTANPPQKAIKEAELAGLNVLLVDPVDNRRTTIKEYLKSWGCQPQDVSDGDKALSVLEEAVSSRQPIDVIITEFQMPKMNGFDLAKTIGTIPDLKTVPIIMLIAVGQRGDGKRCRELKIGGYLQRPFRADDLRKTMERVLGFQEAGDDQTLPELITRHSLSENKQKETRILLVEDYPTNQRVAMKHLQNAGYQVDLAENGVQAIVAYKAKPYDLILMDVQMPKMDGFEATKTIRELETASDGPENGDNGGKPQRTPIIALTAYAVKDYSDKCLDAGMDDCLTKPLKRQKLLDSVEAWTSAQPVHE